MQRREGSDIMGRTAGCMRGRAPRTQANAAMHGVLAHHFRQPCLWRRNGSFQAAAMLSHIKNI